MESQMKVEQQQQVTLRGRVVLNAPAAPAAIAQHGSMDVDMPQAAPAKTATAAAAAPAKAATAGSAVSATARAKAAAASRTGSSLFSASK